MAKVKSDLVDKLKKTLKGKRVGVFIDSANLYHALNKQGFYISFERMSEWFRQQSKELILNLYTAHDPEDEKQQEFLAKLDNLGYKLITKPIKVFENSTKGNMDIELAVDAIERVKDYDVFVLFSGDGDFGYLLQYLHNKGIETVVVGVGGYTSFDLHQEANHYFFLDRIGSIWRQQSTKKKKDLNKLYNKKFEKVVANKSRPRARLRLPKMPKIFFD